MRRTIWPPSKHDDDAHDGDDDDDEANDDGVDDDGGAQKTFTAHFAVTFARYGFVITCSNLYGMGLSQRERGAGEEDCPVRLYDILGWNLWLFDCLLTRPCFYGQNI